MSSSSSISSTSSSSAMSSLSKSDIFDSICCVADAQGFCVKGKFIICELSFYNGTKERHQTFKPDIHWPDLSSRDYKTRQYTRDHIHGLEIHPDKDLPPSSEARSYILEFFRSTREFAKFVGVKNNQLEKELKLLEIPYKRLDEAPKLATLDEWEHYFTPWVCSSHKKIDVPTPRCTVRKCLRFWNWFRDSENHKTWESIWNYNKLLSIDSSSDD